MAKIEEVEEKPVEEQGDNFLSLLLQPGSSLNPTFLLILDGAFATLIVIFLGLLYLTQGNVHFFVLLLITICFWASVKWYAVNLYFSWDEAK